MAETEALGDAVSSAGDVALGRVRPLSRAAQHRCVRAGELSLSEVLRAVSGLTAVRPGSAPGQLGEARGVGREFPHRTTSFPVCGEDGT